MQKINSDALINKARQLLSSGTVSKVLGWKRGNYDYDVTPGFFEDENSLSKFVWNDFCAPNLSKYLIAETAKTEGRILVYLKPCDSFSFNQLLTEHRFDREKVYAVAVPCSGMLSVSRIREYSEGISSVKDNGDTVTITTLYDGDVVVSRSDLLPDRCVNCKSKKHAAYDELLGEAEGSTDCRRFDEVERLENMSPEQRFDFWQSELSRCIRCNACRDICPACTCEKCVFDNPSSGLESKAPSDSFEEKLFHIIRAFHVAGRCTDCGECSRVCPQNIPLHLLNRKFIKEINTCYGEYQAGETVGSRSPLVDYSVGDIEPSERRSNDA